MQRSKKAKNFLPKPIYPGGPKAMRAFIKETLTYPPEAAKKKIEGTVVLRIDINYRGDVIGSTVKSSLGSGCDEEAQRVAGMMKFEVDKKVRKGKILFHKTLNIRFRLPKKKAKTTVSYNLVPEKSQTHKSLPSTDSYTYIIKY